MMWDVWHARPGWTCVGPVEGAQVWLIPLPDEGPPAELGLSSATLACLSPAEHQRAQRFVQARQARLYGAAHAALNVLLAEALSCSPSAVTTEADAHGKPHLIPPRLHFNLSHSAAWALVAMHPTRPLGVDIEMHSPPRDDEALARRIFSPPEWQRWCALDASRRHVALFDAWARKEACLKAQGTGLLTPPEDVSVGVCPRPHVGTWRPDTGPVVHWVDLTLPLAQAHSAALAWLDD